jgi:hypothetical protein
MSPRVRRRAAGGLLIFCVVAWPTTALTIFSSEPQGILGLSWMALILTAADILATTDVRENDE